MAHYMTMHRVGNTLVPDDGLSEERLLSIAEGVPVKATVTVPRNIKFHRLFFKLLDVVFKAQDEPKQFPTEKIFMRELKKAMGFGAFYKDSDGKTDFIEDSIAFDKMDDTEFREFFNRAVDIILINILPNCDKAGLEAQVFEILNLPMNLR
jgi:hypothetical protein